MSTTINNRLKKLESKVLGPRREPKVIQIVFPRCDGSGTSMRGPTMILPERGPVTSNWDDPESWPDYEEIANWQQPRHKSEALE